MNSILHVAEKSITLKTLWRPQSLMYKYWSCKMEKENQGKHYSELTEMTWHTGLDGLIVSSDIKLSCSLSKYCDGSLSRYLSTNLSWTPQEGGANCLENPDNCAVPLGDKYTSRPDS